MSGERAISQHGPQTVRSTSNRALRTLFDSLAATFFPGDCRVCDGPLLAASALPVCASCLVAVEAQQARRCDRCGEAHEQDWESGRFAESLGAKPPERATCAACRQVPPEFERAVAYAEYRDELRQMIHLLKYERLARLANPLGRMLAQAMPGPSSRPAAIEA